MMLRLNEKRLRKEVAIFKFKQDPTCEGDECDAIHLSDLWDIINDMQCNADGCDNEARYDSGYCGIHDIEFNDGKGTRES
jgi:hypothetical protein